MERLKNPTIDWFKWTLSVARTQLQVPIERLKNGLIDWFKWTLSIVYCAHTTLGPQKIKKFIKLVMQTFLHRQR